MPEDDNSLDAGEPLQFGSATWSVADAFTKLKIFKPMFECDRYEMIALYGVEDINDIINPIEIPSRRIEALYRLKDTLKMIFDNSNFIIKKGDRMLFENLRKHLTFIEEILDGCSKIEENWVTHEKHLVINEEHFRKCLRALQKIKEQLNTPLNNAGIIFRQSDEISLEDMMKDIVDSG